MSADLIVIIALAAFVVYKYRQVLGHKTGHDVETPKRPQNKGERVVQLRQYQQIGEEGEDLALPSPELKDEAFEALAEEYSDTAVLVKVRAHRHTGGLAGDRWAHRLVAVCTCAGGRGRAGRACGRAGDLEHAHLPVLQERRDHTHDARSRRG